MDMPLLRREISERILRKGQGDYAMMWVYLQIVRGVTSFLSQALELQIPDGTPRWGK